MTLKNTKCLSSEWLKQPTLSLKVTTKNSFPNTKMVDGTYLDCYSLTLYLGFS